MTAEHGSGPNYERYRSAERVTQLKETIKTVGLLDKSVGGDRKEEIGKNIMEGLGIKRGSTDVGSIGEVVELYRSNIGPNAKDSLMAGIEDLGQAFYEVAAESENPELNKTIVAGPFSVENQLPESMKGLGEVVVKNFTNNENLRRNLDTIDYLKNDPAFNKDKVLLADQVSAAVESIKSMPVSPVLQKDLFREKNLALQYLMTESTSYQPNEGRQGGRNQNRNQAGAGDQNVGFKPAFDPEGNFKGREMAWVVTEEKAAEAMKFMADDLRWSPWTPPEWFKEKSEADQYRIELMVMVNDGASWLRKFQNSDLDKCRMNPLYTAFSGERFSALFNDDFKLASSKMLNDLCETYVNKDGVTMTRYKEENGTVAEGVSNNLKHLESYKEDLATFLAKTNGREKASAEDKMNAYTAWNLWFMMGDSSFADRLRAMAPAAGLISDKLRTLNPEAKSKKKWKLVDKMKKIDQNDLFKSEWFGGPISKWVQTVATREQRSGEALDKKTNKKLVDKIADGSFELFSNITCYGLYDVIGGDCLFKNENGKYVELGKDMTLTKALMNYGKYENGNFVRNGEDFSFGDGQADTKFMADFRDMQESSARNFSILTGKVPAEKDMVSWVNEIRSATGLANGIDLNGRRLFGYTRRPEFWGLAIVGSFGVDVSRLSTDHIYMKLPKGANEAGYDLYIHNLLTTELALNDADVPFKNVMKYLGCAAEHKPGSFLDNLATVRMMAEDKKRTEKLTKIAEKSFSSFNFEVPEEHINASQVAENAELGRLYDALKRARAVNDMNVVDRLMEEIRQIRDRK